MAEYKELPGIEYMPYYSRVDSMECGFGIDWYVCHHCHETFIYDYGKAQRHDPNVKKVYFNQPYTIVIWKDGTKTIVKCSKGCKYDKYTGLVTCFLKKFMGDCGFSKFKKIANNLIKDDE